jgi:hypothetical protein
VLVTFKLPLAISAFAFKINLARRKSVGSSHDEYPWYTALVTAGSFSKRGSKAQATQAIRKIVSVGERLNAVLGMLSKICLDKPSCGGIEEDTLKPVLAESRRRDSISLAA